MSECQLNNLFLRIPFQTNDFQIFSFESFNISKDYIISVKLAQILWYYRHVNHQHRALRAWLENLLLTWAGVSSLVLDHQELGWKTFFSLGLE
jgi:hypothetical protein